MSLPFSRRTAFSAAPNRLAEAFAAARAAPGGAPLVDLTESNATRVGLVAPRALPALLADERAADYAPEAFGLPDARAAVAARQAARGAPVDPARVVLSASTSEAYAWIFKLLADPGDDVLVPTPSYPLFEYLAQLEEVRVVPCPLAAHDGYRLDVGAVERALGPRTRAVVLVSPANPTGTFVRADDAAALDALCAERGVAVIVDEVFAEWPLEPPEPHAIARFDGAPRALTFVLGGLSKSLCAPQLKLAWTLVRGPDPLVLEALARLEVVADTYLSVSTPVQHALERLLRAGEGVRGELAARLRQNLAALDAAIASPAAAGLLRRRRVEGGWCVLVEVPRVIDEDAWVERLAREARVLVSPGWFFDVPDGGTLVVSLLPPPDVFEAGAARLVAEVARVAG